MKKLSLKANRLLLSMALLSAVLQMFLPWWILAVVAFATSYLWAKSNKEAFFKAALVNGTLWFLMATYLHISTDGILSNKVASILHLGGNGFSLALITGLVASTVGGMSGLSGYLTKKAVTASI